MDKHEKHSLAPYLKNKKNSIAASNKHQTSNNVKSGMTIPAEITQQIESFLEFHSNGINPIVCVTSGGTTVPLCSESSVFIDNFSLGERGANSAEYFLSQGYSVVFLYRKESKFPFMKNFHSHFGDQINNTLLSKLLYADDSDEEFFRLLWDSSGLENAQKELLELEGKIVRNMLKYQYLLPIAFQSVEEYLELLEYLGKGLSLFGPRCCFYLAAAVSDFYLPKDQIAANDSPSEAQNKLVLKLMQVPKMLGRLVHEWAPNSFVVSFKLETDEKILLEKAEKAIKKYDVHLVVANLLHSRRNHCILVSRQSSEHVDSAFCYDHIHRNVEEDLVLEKSLIEAIMGKHKTYLKLKYQMYFNQNNNANSAFSPSEVEAQRQSLLNSLMDKIFENKNTLVCQQVNYYLEKTYRCLLSQSSSVGLTPRAQEQIILPSSSVSFSPKYLPMLFGVSILTAVATLQEYFNT